MAGSMKKGGPRDKLTEIINSAMRPEERIEKVAELARGVTMAVVTKEGLVMAYKEKPDLQALRFLEEYATGKPVQVQEVSKESDFAFIMVPKQASQN